MKNVNCFCRDSFKSLTLLPLIAVLFILLSGCQQPKPGATRTSTCKLWPVFDITKSQGLEDDGARWISEKGDAVLIAHWKNRKTYDSTGSLTEYSNHSEVWPLFDTSCSKSQGRKSSSGTILLFLKYGQSDQEAKITE